MNLSLRAKLRLPEGCSNEELQDACSRYYTIYKGVLDSAADSSVKEIARGKLEDLVSHARRENVAPQDMDHCNFREEKANINASVEAQLASMGTGTLSEEQVNRLNGMIAKLPESPKRYYLSALVCLRSKSHSVDSYEEAVSKLKTAISNDPENPIYQAMLSDIEREIQAYRDAYSVWKDEQDRIAKNEERKETALEVLETVWGVVLWIGGALLTIGGVVLSCVCSSCDAC